MGSHDLKERERESKRGRKCSGRQIEASETTGRQTNHGRRKQRDHIQKESLLSRETARRVTLVNE